MQIDAQILPYLAGNAAGSLGIKGFDGAAIRKLPGGDYNFNYHVAVDGRDLLVRLNIEPQSGLDTQIEYEYATLAFLSTRRVTPKPLFLDNSRKHLPYGLLIEEFISGGHLEFSVPAMKRVASAMATLHTTPIDNAPLRRRNNPLREQLDAVRTDLEKYKRRHNPQADILRLGKTVIDKLTKTLPELEPLYTPRSIIHTDPNPANIIDNGERVYLIDWEQGRIDDPSYDIAAFFSDVLNLWASPRTLTDEEKQAFLHSYIAQTHDETIGDRIGPRLMAYTLTAAVWAANRIADVEEGKIDPNLGRQNYARYLAMANPGELEKILSL